MSEPFVLPVDTSLPEKQLAQEMDKIAQFIAAKKEEGMAVSLDHVGDASLSQDAASQYLDFYIQLIRHLAPREEIEEINFSVKLSALLYELEKLQGVANISSATSADARKKAGEAKEALTKLLAAANEAKDKKVFVRIDMEEYAYKDATLAIFKEVVEDNPAIVRNADGSLRLGVVIQAYLRDAYKDLDDLLKWGKKNQLRVPVRLVKGAYEKYEKAVARKKGDTKSPVWSHKESTDASYEKLNEFLALNKEHFQFAMATHNIRSIAHAMALASGCGIRKSEFEFQMLRGMGDEIKEVITSMGYGMRIYVPAGSYARGFKYAGRRFMELANKDNALSRTLRGDYSHMEGPAPRFIGPDDTRDGEAVEALVANARASFRGEVSPAPARHFSHPH
jgi:RHH-type proline utilization regulon transcriptional repressor/proline dehydrogenase/delta 1-pyrroline-5-carboxylate dehydrogenase